MNSITRNVGLGLLAAFALAGCQKAAEAPQAAAAVTDERLLKAESEPSQ